MFNKYSSLRAARRLISVLPAVLALAMFGGGDAAAHSPSNAYLNLTVAGSTVEGRWDIALRDLETAIGLDSDQNGAVDWGEIAGRQNAIAAYALSRLSLKNGARACPTRFVEQQFVKHSEGGYAVLRFVAECESKVASLDIDYSLLFDIDPLHRGLTQIDYAGAVQTAIFSPGRRNWRSKAGAPDSWQQLKTYLVEGIWHIWKGFDHVLFLMSLLLPAVLLRGSDGWRPVTSLRGAFVEVVKIVTAFTIAHSVTLILATLGWIALPNWFVEPVIAATIIVAALNNIYPIVTRGLWMVAFGFGLIHGVGFAGALRSLGLPSDALLVSLLSFNLGVETGQLAIVSVFLPVAFLLRKSAFYPRVVLQFGSTAIVFVAAIWLVERAFNVALIS